MSRKVELPMLCHSQRDGQVVIVVGHEWPSGSAEVVIDSDNVLLLLTTVLNAIRVGTYSDEQRKIAAWSCAAMLRPYLTTVIL